MQSLFGFLIRPKSAWATRYAPRTGKKIIVIRLIIGAGITIILAFATACFVSFHYDSASSSSGALSSGVFDALLAMARALPFSAAPFIFWSIVTLSALIVCVIRKDMQKANVAGSALFVTCVFPLAFLGLYSAIAAALAVLLAIYLSVIAYAFIRAVFGWGAVAALLITLLPLTLWLGAYPIASIVVSYLPFGGTPSF